MGCTQGTVVFEFPSGDYDYTGHKEHYRDDGTYILAVNPKEVLNFKPDGEYRVLCSLPPLIAQCQEILLTFSVLDVGWSGIVDIILTRKGEILFGQEIFVATSSHQEVYWSEVKQKLSLEQEIIHSAEVGDVYQIRRFVGSGPNMKLCIKDLQVAVVGLNHVPPICLQFEEWLVDKTFYLATNQSWKWFPKSIEYWIAWVSTPPLLESPSRVVISFQIKLINVNQSTPYERRDFQGRIKLRLMRQSEVVSQYDVVCCRYETQQVTSKPVRMMFDSASALVSKARPGDYYDIARSVSGKNEQGGVSVLGIHVKQFSLRISGERGVCCVPLRQKIGHYSESVIEGVEEEDLILSRRQAETSVSTATTNVPTGSLGKHQYHQCIRNYATELSKLVKEDSTKIISLFNSSSSSRSSVANNKNGLSLYHIGPHQSTVDFELTLGQLNISSFVHDALHVQCNSTVVPVKEDAFSPSMVYYGNINGISMLEHLSTSESALFVYSELIHTSTSRAGMLPIPFASDGLPSLVSLLESDREDLSRLIWQLYRSLVQCIIPTEKLLILDQTLIVNSSLYWNTVTNFLGVSPTASTKASVKLSNRVLNSLIKSGVPYFKNGRSCVMKDHVCMYSGVGNNRVLVPSVCSLTYNYDLVYVTHPRVIGCAHSYVRNLTTVFGERYRKVLLDKLLKPVVMKLYDTPADIVLNVGPGSTGTRSLHMAMRQLNVTASHYLLFTQNCESIKWSSNESDRRVFGGEQLTLDPIRVFWGRFHLLCSSCSYLPDSGDNPVVQRWWWYFNYYPMTQTRFIMTDANELKWLSVRLGDHCQHPTMNKNSDSGCFLPIPMAYFMYNTYHYDTKALALIKEFSQLASLFNVNNNISIQVFQYYRDLLHCAIDPDRLLWVDMVKDSTNSEAFWRKLVQFMQLDIAPPKVNEIIAAGVPYVGTKGCIINKKNCTYVGQKDKPIPGGSWTSAVVPSVCS